MRLDRQVPSTVMQKSKIFGIGLAKTGTTSLNDAFAILGIASIGCPESIAAIRRFDAATDGIVADEFETLDIKYPGSKFILTVRDPEDWVNSYIKYHGKKKSSLPGHEEITMRLYGTDGTDRETLLAAFHRHETRVHDYFCNRPEDLLILDICGGKSDWVELCNFLNKPVPDAPFPASNPKFSDNIFKHMLYALDDIQLVSKISRAPVDFLKSLSLEGYSPDLLLNEEPTKRGDRILVKCCKHFGNASKAAKMLGLEQEFIEAAIFRHKQRKAGRIKKKSTYIGKQLTKLKTILHIQS